MESVGRLQLHHQPIHLSLTHNSSSFPKQSSLFRPFTRPNSSFKHASVKALSSSKSPTFITPLQKSAPFRFFKSTCVTLTTTATLLFISLQLKSPAIAAPVPPPPSTESNKHVTLEEEERAVEEHLATHPPDVDSLRSLMEVKMRSYKLTEAIQVVDRLIKLEPDKPELPVKKAKIFTYKGDTRSAVTGFEEILAKHPLRVEAYHGLIVAYTDAGLDWKKIESRVEEAMLRCKTENKHKEHREFKLLVAQIRVVRGKHSEALKLYEELVEEEPSDYRPYLCQGAIYNLLKNEDKEKEQYDKFKKLVPENYNYMEDFLENLFAGEVFSEKT